ncbi:MAG: helix-turn-helix transcriptional regulator [Proteobacteria bacterium]|nr:helix-turn-helix transcriptional regulator [Pseudomonadota bacterium]
MEETLSHENQNQNQQQNQPSVQQKQSTIGKLLKNTREELRMSIVKVSEELKVKESDIIALENDDISAITKHLYLVGFIESYANLLKIDNHVIKGKIKELAISSNVDNKKHNLVNLWKGNVYSPNKEVFANALILFLILSLLIFAFNQFSDLDFNISEIVIDALN